MKPLFYTAFAYTAINILCTLRLFFAAPDAWVLFYLAVAGGFVAVMAALVIGYRARQVVDGAEEIAAKYIER